jgi:hypothetical protein
VKHFNIVDSLSFSFPFSLFPSSIVQFHCCQHILPVDLYVIMFCFVYIFIF